MSWRERGIDEVYSEAEVAARLQEQLPSWTSMGSCLRRKYETGGWKGTLLVVNTIGHLAEVAWHHPDLEVSYAVVTVNLSNHDAKGITHKDFALAIKIEEVVMWRPGADAESPLQGTPDDPRFKYLSYD
jgi:4a-hydroxytetrahydrobiopterin dehydratase